MKKRLITGIIILIIILGFIIGAVNPQTDQGCTEMSCSCQGVEGQRPCNSCSYSDQIFITGILNVVRQCRALEIITCQNNMAVDSSIDLANQKCVTDWYILGFNLRNLFSQPEAPASHQLTDNLNYY